MVTNPQYPNKWVCTVAITAYKYTADLPIAQFDGIETVASGDPHEQCELLGDPPHGQRCLPTRHQQKGGGEHSLNSANIILCEGYDAHPKFGESLNTGSHYGWDGHHRMQTEWQSDGQAPYHHPFSVKQSPSKLHSKSALGFMGACPGSDMVNATADYGQFLSSNDDVLVRQSEMDSFEGSVHEKCALERGLPPLRSEPGAVHVQYKPEPHFLAAQPSQNSCYEGAYGQTNPLASIDSAELNRLDGAPGESATGVCLPQDPVIRQVVESVTSLVMSITSQQPHCYLTMEEVVPVIIVTAAICLRQLGSAGFWH